METSPFRLPKVTPFRLLERAAERVTGLHTLDNYYQQLPKHLNSKAFLRRTLETLNIHYNLSSGHLSGIPAAGPLIIVANHPLGAVEGVILAEMLLQVRQDVKVLANQFLKRLPELAPLFISVDVFEGKSAVSANMKALRQGLQHLQNGGVLLVFPAGEVSTFDKQGQLNDKPWSRSVAKLIKRSHANALAMHIHGRNSKPFYWAGMVHPYLRTAMLGREMLNKGKQIIDIAIGDVIEYKELESLNSEQQIVDYLRLNTYLLAPHAEHQPQTLINQTPMMAPVQQNILNDEITSLPTEAHLLNFKNFDVYCTQAERIPMLLQEIGRIREANFRLVNEGTGKACDVDEFDDYYQHLFIWDNDAQRLVGAYRLGLSDQIMSKKGVKGLYSRTLFRYDKKLIEQFGHAIEMGRSVIDLPYQRSLTALLLLWKGIATYAYRNPHYTHLFGPVSISSEYSPTARELMVSTLEMHHFDRDSANLVKATNPLKKSQKNFWRADMLSSLADIQLLSKVLTRLGQKSIPVLLKQYLNLNGKLISFNVDKDFNDALDGLIVVDLRKVPARTLAKYMGKEESTDYLKKHKSIERN
ncbi:MULTISPECIES: lysophospholipid acyltransferase family protein [Vibrio]|uniref:L-ornithine N(alpha)-acyltransferase n=1 Tax=Vibrio casei TaxID=673372 RepID=A0A368LKA4_9VIBR|nr:MULTISPECIES: GNAT family N-acyltransferase [Vibrio]RCS72312.1 GNAT family N-acetyltransferase [Vibrio casei]SJN29821.1 Putative hemolysin [Vibrio casei]HBV77985.1 GNAT family N-acetyltransferase [Vibrio sp.]